VFPDVEHGIAPDSSWLRGNLRVAFGQKQATKGIQAPTRCGSLVFGTDNCGAAKTHRRISDYHAAGQFQEYFRKKEFEVVLKCCVKIS
jgi:hypothetical protein